MKLYVLDLGKIVMVGDNPVTQEGETAAIPIHAFLLDTPAGKILFDTGCVPGCMEGAWPAELCTNPFVPAPNGSLTERLEQIGVSPEEITCVVASHLHLDHAGGLHLFPNARVLVQAGELERVLADAEAGTLDMFHLPCDVENWKRAGIRWQPVEGAPLELCEGVTVLDLGPGHSFGMLGMRVTLECGTFLLVSDAVYSSAYYGPPAQLSGAVEDEAGYFAAIETIRTMEKTCKATVLYGHDMPQFQSLRKSTEGYYQ